MSSELEQSFAALRRRYIEGRYAGLNPMQRKAVFAPDGPMLILAGAGSGKTTVLVNRIANLIRFGRAYGSSEVRGAVTQEDLDALRAAAASGSEPDERLRPLLAVDAVRPWHVLAITFTNKAAGELKERLGGMLGQDAQQIAASTFHSACVRILRREASSLGLPSAFAIYDTDDSQRAMKEVFKQQNIDDRLVSVKSALASIGRLKDRMIGPRDAAQQATEYRAGVIAAAYAGYSAKLAAAGALDFDDLIYDTVLLFGQHPEILEAYNRRWTHVFVDEYQDTSIAQFELVRMLGGEARRVTVVGDDDQSIYRFRGATVENILSFERSFPGAEVIKLEQNYRSTAEILDAANRVIRNNSSRKGKTLWTEKTGGEKVQLYRAADEADEAARIASVIGQHLRGGAHLRDHAILYRMNAQSGPIETYFARSGIPYRVVGGHRFFDRKEVKDILAYLAVIANPQDELRLRRIVNEPPRKIGAATLDTAAGIAEGLGCGLLQVLEEAQNYPALSRVQGPVRKFTEMMTQLRGCAASMPLDGLVLEVIDRTGYKTMLEAAGEEGKTRLENLGQLVSSVKSYADEAGEEASLDGYLEQVALISDIDSFDETADAVTMMTIHSAKGLEFPFVFLVGLEEGVFPGEGSRWDEEDLEEERRLCYVGITRAKKELYLSCADTRMLFGQTRRNPASRFLAEIGEDTLQITENRRGRADLSGARRKPEQPAAVRFASDRTSLDAGMAKPAAAKRGAGIVFAPGDRVDHRVFGCGTVLKVTPIAGDCIVEIRFDTAGVKKTMANYAPLTKIQGEESR